MHRSGITHQLEQQAKHSKDKRIRALKQAAKRTQKNADPLRLRWKDVVIFSLLVVFGGGYFWQIDHYRQCQSAPEIVLNKRC